MIFNSWRSVVLFFKGTWVWRGLALGSVCLSSFCLACLLHTDTEAAFSEPTKGPKVQAVAASTSPKALPKLVVAKPVVADLSHTDTSDPKSIRMAESHTSEAAHSFAGSSTPTYQSQPSVEHSDTQAVDSDSTSTAEEQVNLSLISDVKPLLCSGDVDGDGDIDIIAAERVGSRVWLNQRDGVFAPGPSLINRPCDAMFMHDMNGDKREDWIELRDNHVQVWLNHPGIGFHEPQQRIGPVQEGSLNISDVDRDGDLDFAFLKDGQCRQWHNSGNGYFYDSGLSARAGGDSLLVGRFGHSSNTQWVSTGVLPAESALHVTGGPAFWFPTFYGVVRAPHNKPTFHDVMWSYTDDGLSLYDSHDQYWRSLARVKPIDHVLDITVTRGEAHSALLVAGANKAFTYIHAISAGNSESTWQRQYTHGFTLFDDVRLVIDDFDGDQRKDVLAVYWLGGQLRGTTVWKQLGPQTVF